MEAVKKLKQGRKKRKKEERRQRGQVPNEERTKPNKKHHTKKHDHTSQSGLYEGAGEEGKKLCAYKGTRRAKSP